MLVASLKVALVAVMVLYPNFGVFSTAKAAPAAGSTQSVFAKTGTLKGVLVDQATGKPIAGQTLTVLDAQGKKVVSAITDKNGKFELPNLKPGQYRLAIGDVELKLIVADTGTATNLKIVMPKSGAKLAPGMVEAAAGASNWTYIALAGLTAAILVPTGFAIAAANDGGDDGHD